MRSSDENGTQNAGFSVLALEIILSAFVIAYGGVSASIGANK